MTTSAESEYKFYPVCSVDDIPEGKRIFIEVKDFLIVILNIEGKFYAIEDMCTHDYCPLGDGELEGYEIVCPCHGARFDVRDGKVLSMPAVKDVASFPLRITDGNLEIGIESK
ncbi:MAG: non-heme iron oxygenase ferredoxin subunit [Chloroflexota bacterium]